MELSDLGGRATITVPEAGEVLGIGRDAAYAAAKKGDLPTLRLGRRLLVPVPALLAMVGAVPDTDRDKESSAETPDLEAIHFELRRKTAAGFLESRASWLEIGTVENATGGWDVVMRLDGTYSGEVGATKEQLVQFFRDQLTEVLEHEGIRLRR